MFTGPSRANAPQVASANVKTVAKMLDHECATVVGASGGGDGDDDVMVSRGQAATKTSRDARHLPKVPTHNSDLRNVIIVDRETRR